VRIDLLVRLVIAALSALVLLAPLGRAEELTYRALAPPQWDGKSALPLLLYLHGYGQTSDEIANDKGLVDAVAGFGALFVIPDRPGHAWAHRGAPTEGRDDIGFLRAVIADAKAKFPIDGQKIYAAGFSVGGSMVWDLACHAAQGFAAFLPVSGAFWVPYPEKCETGPVNLRHVHGLTDTTVPMGGRTIFGRYTQGDVAKGWDILRATDRCASREDLKAREGLLTCQTWSSCASGHQLQLCVHDDGHEIEPAWLLGGLRWAASLNGQEDKP
jgi:polyhydroxybutyrate depolymerase